jgi:dTDP-glucose 4,6-dehydratase
MENILREDMDHILNKTRELWEEIRGKRLFITGGTGFFGCWLLESFAWANSNLGLNSSALVLTRNPQAFRQKAPNIYENPAIMFHTGDVRNFEFPDGEFTHIIHAATGDTDTIVKDPVSIFEGMVQGTRRALDFASRCNARKFLYISSGAVYGKQPPDLSHIPEDHAGAPEMMNPVSAYGEAKRVSEFLTAAFAKHFGFEAKIARCFAFVGPYMHLDANYAIGNFIRNALSNEPILVRGDGTPYRSYLYAADLAIWLWTILFRGIPCRPYNVGSDNEFTIADVAKAVAHCLLENDVIYISKKASPCSSTERYVPSVLRAQHELGLRQSIDLQNAISKTMSWYSRQ